MKVQTHSNLYSCVHKKLMNLKDVSKISEAYPLKFLKARRIPKDSTEEHCKKQFGNKAINWIDCVVEPQNNVVYSPSHRCLKRINS